MASKDKLCYFCVALPRKKGQEYCSSYCEMCDLELKRDVKEKEDFLDFKLTPGTKNTINYFV